MDFGIMIMIRGPGGNAEGLTALAQAAENGGAEYIALNDHVVVPADIDSRYPYSKSGEWAGASVGECLEVVTAASFVASATSKARILTAVLVVPYRPPVLAAVLLTTVDVLSGGRLTVGCGAGWMREEFEALETPPYDERGKVTDEFIAIFRKLWNSEQSSYQGDYVTVPEIIFEPKSSQKNGPPIWIGGESPPAMRRAGRIGDGWYPANHNPAFPLNTPELYGAAAARLDQAAEAAGRDPGEVHRGITVLTPASAEPRIKDGVRTLFTGEPGQYAEDIAAYAEKGVQTMVFNAVSPDLNAGLEKIDWLTREIFPLGR